SLSPEAGLSADVLPATIQQAVEKRIERLPDDLRLILSMASVIGKAFDSRDGEALAEGKDIDDASDRLAQEGLSEEERGGGGERGRQVREGHAGGEDGAAVPRRRGGGGRGARGRGADAPGAGLPHGGRHRRRAPGGGGGGSHFRAAEAAGACPGADRARRG